MPEGTRVARCVEHVKKSGKGVNPYAVCQSATHQSYATGKPLSKLPKGASLSPKGDLGAQRVAEGAKAIRGSAMGSSPKASSYLPFTREKMMGDTPGLSVRQAPKDDVV